MPGEAKEIQHVVDDQFDLNSLEQRIETSVTASVVGKGSARVVEMFKLSCESTMQHLFGVAAKMTGNGVAWFEQGKSWEGKGTSRAEALRGVQAGMFNLRGLSPIAALRIAASANQGSHEAFPFRRQGPINRSRMMWTLFRFLAFSVEFFESSSTTLSSVEFEKRMMSSPSPKRGLSRRALSLTAPCSSGETPGRPLFLQSVIIRRLPYPH